VYHLELRQFPHNLNRYNLDDRTLWAIVEPWVRERVFELGERKWSPHQAELKILEGPQLALGDLSLGRGWRLAEREGVDVTERVLERASEAIAAGYTSGEPAPQGAVQARAAEPAQGLAQEDAAAPSPAGDPLALSVELGALLGAEPGRLLAAWRGVATRAPALAPSESLALAEREIASPGSERAR